MGVKIYQQLCRLKRKAKKETPYSIREINAFGEEYNHFWEKLRGQYDVLAVRNQKTLNTLFYGTSGLKSERKILEIRKQKELIGYVAVKEVVRPGEAEKNIRYYEMMDAALLEHNQDLFVEIIKAMECLAQKNRIAWLRIFPLLSEWESMMRQMGFLKMTKEFRFVYKGLPDLQGLNHWLTPIDGDRGFF